MRRTTAALLLVPALTIALAGCGDSGGSDDSTVTQPTAGGTALKIKGFAYDPKDLTVAPGASISATNSDSATHDVTSDQTGLFKSGDIDQGKTVTFKAPTAPGKYTYVCSYHSNMKGSITVK